MTELGREYEYDVAFSFLSRDEGVAAQINERLRDRLATFFYADRQVELAGKDGQVEFSRVFGEHSRTVVVVWSEGWGEAGYTLIEKQAIQNRGFTGFDFVFVVFAGRDRDKLHSFFPRTQIYFDWERFGLERACGAIEAHIRRQGGQPEEATFETDAAQLHRQLQLDAKRNAFRNSSFGKEWVQTQVQFLIELVRVKISESPLRFGAAASADRVRVEGFDVRLDVSWRRKWGNTLDESELVVTYHDLGSVPVPLPNAVPPLLGEPLRFVPDLSPAEKPSWRGDDEWLTSEELANKVLRRLLQHVH